jgi:hypothetical protein
VAASLALRHGVLWIATCVRSTKVVPYDRGGRRLAPGFAVRGADGGRTDVRGIAVDEDRRLWIADAAHGSLRAFSVFGAEVQAVLSTVDPDADDPGAYGDSEGIAAQGIESDSRLLLARRGERRHALLVVDPLRGTLRSLRPDGDAEGRCTGLGSLALAGSLVFACEPRRRRVQVFRDGEFLFAIATPAPAPGARALVPRAVAALGDGRSIVACGCEPGGALLLFDGGGRLVETLVSSTADDLADLDDPSGVAVEAGGSDPSTQVFVLDRDGSRVQSFALDGRCHGSFQEAEPAEAEAPSKRSRAGRPGTP